MVAPTLFINDTGNDVHLLYRATLIFWWSLTIAVSSLLLNSDICSSIPTLQNHLMVTDFLWMHYDFLSSPQFWHFSSILTFGQTPQKWPILAPKKVNVRPAEKSHSPNPYWYGLFAKNRVQIGQIWPLWPNIHLPGHIGGRHPVPCLSTQIAERQGTAMY